MPAPPDSALSVNVALIGNLEQIRNGRIRPPGFLLEQQPAVWPTAPPLREISVLQRLRELRKNDTWMIGNSPKSDINPALEAGLNAVLVPHENTWV